MSTRYYTVDIKFTTRWEHLKKYRTLADAMGYIRNIKEHKYPLRVQRVVKTTLFEEK